MIRNDSNPLATDAGADARPPVTRPARTSRFSPARRRPWWKWLLIGLLLLFSLTVTILYATVLVADIASHHWTDALDASRDAVPAIVGWAALLILFFTGGTVAAERLLSADSYALTEKQRKADQAERSVQGAEGRVVKLSAKLDQLTAARATAGPHAATGLDRQIEHTSARLDKARQWLAGAQSALAAVRHDTAEAEQRLVRDFPSPAAGSGPSPGKPA